MSYVQLPDFVFIELLNYFDDRRTTEEQKKSEKIIIDWITYKLNAMKRRNEYAEKHNLL